MSEHLHESSPSSGSTSPSEETKGFSETVRQFSSQNGPFPHGLAIMLSAAVPLRIFSLYEGGVITQRHMQELEAFGQVLGEQGDKLLFGSKKAGEAASLANRLAQALAVLAHLPGGVTIFGQHFDALSQLSAWIGEERATTYYQQVWQLSPSHQSSDAT